MDRSYRRYDERPSHDRRDYDRPSYERPGYDRRDDDRRYGRRDDDRDDRGFLDRAGDEVRSWFGDDDAARRRRTDDRFDDRRDFDRRFDDRHGFDDRNRFGDRARFDDRFERRSDRDTGFRDDDRYASRYDRAGYTDPSADWNDDERRFAPRHIAPGNRDYDRGRDAGQRYYRGDDYDRDNAGGYAGEYRRSRHTPERGADRYGRDSYRDYGLPSHSYGMGRR